MAVFRPVLARESWVGPGTVQSSRCHRTAGRHGLTRNVVPWLFDVQVLAPLGADTSGSQFLEPDGTFPNHIPNPENKEAMAAAVNMVKQSGESRLLAVHCGSSMLSVVARDANCYLWCSKNADNCLNSLPDAHSGSVVRNHLAISKNKLVSLKQIPEAMCYGAAISPGVTCAVSMCCRVRPRHHL